MTREPAICPICGTEYPQRWDRIGEAVSTPASDMSDHIRFCQCYHCEHREDIAIGHMGTCHGGIPNCADFELSEKRLAETKRREKAHRAQRRMP